MAYDLKGFLAFSRRLKVENGESLKLKPFQKAILKDHFGSARELVVVIPKKNGKTTLLAALALYHLAETPQAEVPIVAASREQAGTMFRQAEKLIRNSGERLMRTDVRGRQLFKHEYELAGVTYEVRPGYREIRAREGRIKVLAADADTADGVIPTLALVDELHRHRDADLYGVLQLGIGPQHGRMVTISTAGASEDSVLGRLRTRAHKAPSTKITGRHLRYDDGEFVLHELALAEGDNPQNLTHVKRVNPLQTTAELRRIQASPSTTPGQWLRYVCGVWTFGDEPEITGARWDALQVDEPWQLKDGDDVYLAPVVRHGAAIGIASMRADGKVAVRVEHVSANGSSILERAEDVIVALCDRYRVLQCVDPMYGFQRSAQLLENRGVPMVEAAYSVPRRVAATGTFDRYLHSGTLLHDGDPVTREQVLHAQKKHGETGEHYLIDEHSLAVTALSQAVHAATAPVPEAPEFGVL